MKIAICDDVIEEQNELQTFCQQLGYCDISLFSCGEDFLNAPDSSQFHLLFLDIEMKGLTGIELKALLEKTNPSIFIVFTTTHEEMMPEAFGRNVISFLTKPLDLNSIKHCLTKATYLQMDFFPIAINDCVFIPCQDILYLHSENKYFLYYKWGFSYFARFSYRLEREVEGIWILSYITKQYY